jgi:hypothetical protein
MVLIIPSFISGSLCRRVAVFLRFSITRLVYAGRGVDDHREVFRMTVNDLERAIEEHLAGRLVSVPLTNPIGCNVKWEGKDAHWMPPEARDLESSRSNE